MLRIMLIYCLIPSVIALLLVSSFYERNKSETVHNPRIITLYIPLLGVLIITFGLFANLFFYDNYIDWAIILILGISDVLGIFILYNHICNIIKYDSEKLIYKRKIIFFDDIVNFGYDDRFYYFVIRNGNKIKISRLAVGFDDLYKAIVKKRGDF